MRMRIRRKGILVEVYGMDIAVGEVMILKAAVCLPAYVRILQETDLCVSEAMITGEIELL